MDWNINIMPAVIRTTPKVRGNSSVGANQAFPVIASVPVLFEAGEIRSVEQPSLIAIYNASIAAATDVTVLVVAATDILIISKIILQKNLTQVWTLRSGATVQIRTQVSTYDLLYDLDFSPPIVWGADGDDFIIRNDAAGAQTPVLSVYGWVVTL